MGQSLRNIFAKFKHIRRIVWIHLDSLWLWHVPHEFVMSPMPKVHRTYNSQQFELLNASPRWLNIKFRLYYAHKGGSYVTCLLCVCLCVCGRLLPSWRPHPSPGNQYRVNLTPLEQQKSANRNRVIKSQSCLRKTICCAAFKSRVLGKRFNAAARAP